MRVALSNFVASHMMLRGRQLVIMEVLNVSSSGSLQCVAAGSSWVRTLSGQYSWRQQVQVVVAGP